MITKIVKIGDKFAAKIGFNYVSVKKPDELWNHAHHVFKYCLVDSYEEALALGEQHLAPYRLLMAEIEVTNANQ